MIRANKFIYLKCPKILGILFLIIFYFITLGSSIFPLLCIYLLLILFFVLEQGLGFLLDLTIQVMRFLPASAAKEF